MNERWTSPKAGPFPSGHLVVWTDDGATGTRCGRDMSPNRDEIASFTPEPPSTWEGRPCKTCLRLANRDVREIEAPPGSGEDDGSTQAWGESGL